MASFMVDHRRTDKQITWVNETSGVIKSLFQASELVLGAGILIALGAWGGFCLDGILKTKPLFTLLLPLGGATWGIGTMIAKALAIGRQAKPTIDKVDNSDKSS